MSWQPAAASPDLAASANDLRCPLCDYDVRGLPEPRCPECGHRFEWEEVTDPEKRRLRWFVEHGPFAPRYSPTQWRLVWPGVFWGRVRPSHAMSRRRIAQFWGTGLAVYLLAFVLMLAGTAAFYQVGYAQTRAVLTRTPGLLANSAAAANLPPEQYLDAFFPTPRQLNFWLQVLSHTRWGAPLLVPLAVSGSLWLVLKIMVRSFQRAKIKPVHRWRVIAYATDPLPGGLTILCFAAYWLPKAYQIFTAPIVTLPLRFWLWPVPLIGITAAALLAVTWLRTEAAVRRYLAIPHAWAVATAALLIAALPLMTLVLNLWYPWW